MNAAAPRHITLCADDYGISPGVNRAIRNLIQHDRINATSVMVVGGAIGRDEIDALRGAAEARAHCSIGLHVTLTAPFSPLTMHYRPLEGGMFLPLGRMLRLCLLRQIDPGFVRGEIEAQLAAFKDMFGRPPAYVDGHQHVQLFPQVREAFIDAVKDAAPGAWVRQCRRDLPLAQRIGNPKAFLLDTLSAKFQLLCKSQGLSTNPAFAGAYDFAQQSDFGSLMQGFLNGLPDGGLVMCHPGVVDDMLKATDPFTGQREREYEFLNSDNFTRLLAETGVSLIR